MPSFHHLFPERLPKEHASVCLTRCYDTNNFPLTRAAINTTCSAPMPRRPPGPCSWTDESHATPTQSSDYRHTPITWVMESTAPEYPHSLVFIMEFLSRSGLQLTRVDFICFWGKWSLILFHSLFKKYQ